MDHGKLINILENMLDDQKYDTVTLHDMLLAINRACSVNNSRDMELLRHINIMLHQLSDVMSIDPIDQSVENVEYRPIMVPGVSKPLPRKEATLQDDEKLAEYRSTLERVIGMELTYSGYRGKRSHSCKIIRVSRKMARVWMRYGIAKGQRSCRSHVPRAEVDWERKHNNRWVCITDLVEFGNNRDYIDRKIWLLDRLERVKDAHRDILDRLLDAKLDDLLARVDIGWGPASYRKRGHYDVGHNQIQVNKPYILRPDSGGLDAAGSKPWLGCDADTERKLMRTIWHEILHIKFRGHGGDFWYYERMYRP